MKVESLCSSCCFIFLLLVSSVLEVIVSSEVSRPFFTARLQADLSLARVSQEFVSMFMDFRSRLQMSLNPTCGLPAGRFPSASSPYRMSFGILPSSILQTCPSHRRRRSIVFYFIQYFKMHDFEFFILN